MSASNPSITIRGGAPTDHQPIISVMPAWWDGRDLSATLPKVFFIHFSDTIFIAERGGELVGFLVGFFSQVQKDVGYVHFVGVHPGLRKLGLARRLYEKFYAACRQQGKSTVKSCTSPVNQLSIAFHRSMGYKIEQGDGVLDGFPVTMNYLGENNPKVLFKKEL